MQTNDRTAAAQCKESLQKALREVQSIERRCEKVQEKFPLESSQGSLLKNRLRAIRVAERLLEAALRGETAPILPREELECAVAPLASIHHKCAAAQEKMGAGHAVLPADAADDGRHADSKGADLCGFASAGKMIVIRRILCIHC